MKPLPTIKWQILHSATAQKILISSHFAKGFILLHPFSDPVTRPTIPFLALHASLRVRLFSSFTGFTPPPLFNFKPHELSRLHFLSYRRFLDKCFVRHIPSQRGLEWVTFNRRINSDGWMAPSSIERMFHKDSHLMFTPPNFLLICLDYTIEKLCNIHIHKINCKYYSSFIP